MSSPSPETFDIRLDSLLQVFSGLQNPYTGMGNPYVDPTQHTWTQPGLSRLSRQEQSALVRQSGLLKKLTTNLPKAATWRWGRTTLANGNAKLLQAIADAVNDIPVVTPLQRIGKTRKGYQVAGELALQTGNSGFILDVDDGKKLDEPLDRKNIKRINKLALLSRHTLRPDISTLSNGLPEHFIVLNAYNLKEYSNGQRIHRSRVHWFRGIPILDDFDLIANNGCDDSILELVRDAWYLYQPAVQAAGRMLTDFDVPVRKVKDLAQNLADRGDEYKAELQSRLQVDQISRSNYRTQVVDMDNEALDHWTRQVAGMADLLGVTKDNFLGNIDVPPAVAFGEFASGLNSTGKSTTEKQLWNEAAAQFQVDKYDDNIQDLQEIVCLCKDGPTKGDLPDGLGWEWLSPYPPDAAEQADLELKRAQLIQDLNGVDQRFGKVAIAATYGQKEYSSTITLPKPYADALQRDIKEEAKPQPTEPDVSALQGDQPGTEDQQTPDTPDTEGGDQQGEADQQQADEAIADDILNDRTLLDSADRDRLDSKYSHINFTPPSSVRNAFKRGLGLHEKGLTGSGLEPATVRVAKAIAAGSPVSPEQVRKGYRWFSRNQRFANASKDSPAWSSWMLWGGSDGMRWYNKLYRQLLAADQRADSIHLDATRQELLAKAKAKNEGLEKGKRFNTFGKSNAAIAEFVGEGTAQQSTTKTTAKPKGGTQKGKYQTKQTSSAIATAIAKKTGASAEAIEQDLRGKIQKVIDKTRREAKKAGKEPTEKELRAAARAVVKVEAKSAIASARGEVKQTAATAKSEPVPAKKAKATDGKKQKTEKVAKPVAEKPSKTKPTKTESNKQQPLSSRFKSLSKNTPAATSTKQSKPEPIDNTLDQLGYQGLEKKVLMGHLEKLGTTPIDKLVKATILQPRDSSDNRKGWLDRIAYIHRYAKKDRLSKQELENIADYGNEQDMFRSATPAGKASRALIEDAYNKASTSGKNLLALKLGRNSTLVGEDPHPFIKEINERKANLESSAAQKQTQASDRKLAQKASRTKGSEQPTQQAVSTKDNPVQTLLSFKEKDGESILDSRKRRQDEYKTAAEKAKELSKTLPVAKRLNPDEWRTVKSTQQDRDDFAISLWGKDRDVAPPVGSDILALQKKAQNPPYVEELMALKLYTKSEYLGINQALRGQKSTLDTSTANRDAKLVTSMLNHLPDHKGTVYRGIGVKDGMSLDDIEKMYKLGSTVVEKAFTSTTPDKPEGQNAFARKPVQFVIKSKTGKNVQEYAHTTQEKEVLFRPDTAFKVSKVERKGDRLTIHMEEADEPTRSAKAPKAEPKTTEPASKAKAKDKAISEAKPKESAPVAEKPVAETKAEKPSKAKVVKTKAKAAKPEVDFSDFGNDDYETPMPKFGAGKRTGKITRKKELDQSRQTLEKSFGKELVNKAEQNMQQLVDKADVYIRAPETAISKIIKDGGFKTAFDRDMSDPNNPDHNNTRDYVSRRIEAEQMLFGKDYDPPNAHRPIYGYLGNKDFDVNSLVQKGPSQYGNVAVRLKPDAKKKATITDSDSWASSLPSDAEKVNAATFTGAGMQKDGSGFIYNGESTAKKGLENAASAKSIDEFLNKHGSGYLETHIHDGVKSSDIAELIYTNGTKPEKDVQDWAKKNGVKLTIK